MLAFKLQLPLIVCSGLLLVNSVPAYGDLHTIKENLVDTIIFQEAFKPPGDKAPKSSQGAGSRREAACTLGEGTVIPLRAKINYGLTLAPTPQILVYIPKTKAKQVLLVLRDEDGKIHDKSFLPIKNYNHILSFQLPKETKPLKVGKNYQWSLAIVCDRTLQPDDPVFQGWVQRVELNKRIELALFAKSPLKKAQWYAENGYWYDLITILSAEKNKRPFDKHLNSIWKNLLKSQGLEIGSSIYLTNNY
jgi:hypothetical protein